VHVTPVQRLVPVHTPSTHWSPEVPVFPSSQVVPFGAFGFEHVPVPGLQVPAT